MSDLVDMMKEMDFASWFTLWDIIELYVIRKRPLEKIFDDLYIVCNEYSKMLTGKEIKKITPSILKDDVNGFA